MRPIVKRRLRRYAIASVIAAVPLAVLCLYVTNLLVPTEPLARPARATYNVVNTAAINDESTTIGIADSDMYDPNLTEEQIIQRFEDMESLGVETLRVLVPWGAIQRVPPGDPLEAIFPQDWERIDFILSQAQERGFSVLGVLNSTPYWGGANGQGCLGCPAVPPDPTMFATFAGEAVTRFNELYPGVMSAYEVWNEPNSFRSWSPAVDPVAYTEVLKAAYTAIKNADPDATVVAGVLGAVVSFGGFTMDPVTFVETMYANGAKGFFDAISYHPYNYDKTLAEQNPGFLSPLRSLIEMRQTMIDNGDDLLKIWATEYGLPTHIKTYEEQERFIRDFLTTWADGLTDAQMAQLPAQFREIVDNWDEWVGPSFIYTLRDRLGLEDTEQGSLGIYYFDEATGQWKMKPAAEVIKDLIDERNGPDNLAEALAASLQALVGQVAEAVATAVETSVVPAVTQTVQQVGQQVGNALANALAAWLGSLGKTPTATATVAAVQTIDTASVAEQSVAETLPATESEVVTEEATEEVTEDVTEPVEQAVVESEETEPVGTESEAVEPVVTEPEVTEPVTEPEVTEPEVTEPEVTDPEVVEPEAPPASEEEEPAIPGARDEVDEETPVDLDDEDADGDESIPADDTELGGKHSEGNVDHGVSVQDLQDRLDREAADAGTDGTESADGADGASEVASAA